MKLAILQAVRQLKGPDLWVWDEIEQRYPQASLFVLGASADGIALEGDEGFVARADALLRVPARRASGAFDMAAVTLPLDIRGRILNGGRIEFRDMQIATPTAR